MLCFFYLLVCFLKIEDVVNKVKPVNVKVESVPIVVGSLFKQVGIPVVSWNNWNFRTGEILFWNQLCNCWISTFALFQVPMRHLGPAKLAYLTKNLHDWCDFHGIKGFKFPSNFPLRTVLPMRVLLANDDNDRKLQAILCKLVSEYYAMSVNTGKFSCTSM